MQSAAVEYAPSLERDYVEHLSTTDAATPFGLMRFRLTYLGSLPPVGRSNQPEAKWGLRKQLNPQIKDLYAQEAILSGKPKFMVFAQETPKESIDSPRKVGAYEFIPLIRKSLSMACELDVTFLRPGLPRSLIAKTGDLDNHLNTLFDGLKMPHPSDLAHGGDIEQPFYCLMDDDALVTGLTVRTDRLLAPPTNIESYAHVLIDVTIRIMEVTPDNYRFVGIW